MTKPVTPVLDDVSRPFWEACNERRLTVQNCTACDRKQFPPEAKCANCGSDQNLEWREVTGHGVIDGFVVVSDSRIVAFQDRQPYNVGIIALQEDPTIKFFANLPGTPLEDVPVGAPVELTFEDSEGGQLIPEWRVIS